MLKRIKNPKRNDRCPCGSGRKYKFCCINHAQSLSTPVMRPKAQPRQMDYIDTGEDPVRYVITDRIGTSFFSTKDNEVIVFKNRADAFVIATLPDFEDQEVGEINVAGVGETKWQKLQEKLPYIEVEDAETAVALVRERIELAKAQIDAMELPGETNSESEIVNDSDTDEGSNLTSE